jgi:DNA polymerase V
MEPQPLSDLDVPTRPLYLVRVPAGFPSPADDYIEANLNLHDYVVRRPSSTFFTRAAGDSMEPGIKAHDLLVVDKSIDAANGLVIVASVDGEFTVKRFFRERGRVMLKSDNPRYAPIPITEAVRFEVWGVVTYIVRDKP